ncbi:unnamed protein product, partial [marine sediment metagenome]
LVVSCLMVTALLLTSCAPAAVEGEAAPPEEVAPPLIEEEEAPPEEVAPPPVEEEAAPPEEAASPPIEEEAAPPEETAPPPIEEEEATPGSPGEVQLPEPSKDSDVSIEEALLKRRSIRTYTGEALTLQEVSQLLWAAQGTTSLRGFRTAPSAAALYPLETYIVVGDVENLSEGVYRYETRGHKLVRVLEGDYRPQLTRASLGQYFVEGGAAYIVFTAVYERTTLRAGDEGIKYVHMEVGHAAQNVYLQAVSLGLGTVVIGGFSGSRAQEILKLPENETPLYFMPVGRM